MRDKTIVIASLLVALMMLSFATPALAFYHPDGSEDLKFEIFGPRVDRLLYVKYGSLDSEIAALQAGEIDITEWPLTPALEAQLLLDTNIVVGEYGGEAGYYTLSMNANNNTYLGNPPDPTFPNPITPNPTADVWFRRALSHTIDNAAIVTAVGGGCDPIYTPIPAYMSFWIHEEIAPGGLYEDLTYPFDPSYAVPAALLDAHHFPVDGVSGKRYYDMNEDGNLDTGEAFQMKVYTRADLQRKTLGDQEEAGLIALDINYVRYEVTSAQARQVCMIEKNYNTYTSGWIYIGPDPDYLYDLYSWDNYYHDGIANPPNIAAIGKYDAVSEDLLHQLKFAQNEADALVAARAWQIQFATMAYEKPGTSTAAPKAWNKYYTGGNDGVILGTDDGENQYRGDLWDQIVNMKGIGVNSFFGVQNMYPVGHPWGDGTHMTIREGWEQTDMPAVVNPIYSSWYWESEVWGRSIDSGGARNPYTLATVSVPQLFENWTVGTWVDPQDSLTKSAITVRMRPDVYWNDGVQATIDDFIYTLTVLPGELQAKGCADAWWQPTLDQVAGSYRLDNYTAQILMRVNSYFSVNWIVGNAILPKHFWAPFVASNPPEVIQGDIAPGSLIGTGPYNYVQNIAGVSATMEANPTYYQPDEVGVIKEDPQSGIEFVATSPANQLTPVKIKDTGAGTGLNVIVKVQNLHAYSGVTFSETIVIQKIFPGPGAPTTLYNNGAVTLASKAINTQTFAQTLTKGLYAVTVTVQKSGGVAHSSTKYLWITVAGDINGDWIVDIFDIAPIALAFGSIRGGPGYNAIADINRDNIIDIFDIVQVALVFGWDP